MIFRSPPYIHKTYWETRRLSLANIPPIAAHDRRFSEEEAVMKPLPRTQETILLRTDFSNDAAWDAICSAARVPGPDVHAALELYAEFSELAGQPLGPFETFHVVADREYAGITVEQLIEGLGTDSGKACVFVVDAVAISHPDHPILVVDLCDEPGRTFRTVPSQASGIESNLSLANMGWEEFADCVDDRGVFRGFRKLQ